MMHGTKVAKEPAALRAKNTLQALSISSSVRQSTQWYFYNFFFHIQPTAGVPPDDSPLGYYQQEEVKEKVTKLEDLSQNLNLGLL